MLTPRPGRRFASAIERTRLDRKRMPHSETLYALARKRTGVTLLYASRNEVHNNATALKELIDGSRKPPTGLGPRHRAASNALALGKRS
jgi:hypothetical protein